MKNNMTMNQSKTIQPNYLMQLYDEITQNEIKKIDDISNQQLPFGTVINQGCLMLPKRQYLQNYKLVFEYTEEKDLPVIAVISPQDFKDAM